MLTELNVAQVILRWSDGESTLTAKTEPSQSQASLVRSDGLSSERRLFGAVDTNSTMAHSQGGAHPLRNQAGNSGTTSRARGGVFGDVADIQNFSSTIFAKKGPAHEREDCWSQLKAQTVRLLKKVALLSSGLLWSKSTESLFNACFADLYDEATYREYQIWTSLLFASLVACLSTWLCSIHPPMHLWPSTFLFDCIGYYWGFRIKEAVVYYAYEFHALNNMTKFGVQRDDVEFEYCALVNPDAHGVNDSVSESGGWRGYNLDWTYYSMEPTTNYSHVVDPCQFLYADIDGHSTTTHTPTVHRHLESVATSSNVNFSGCNELAAHRSLSETTSSAEQQARLMAPGSTCNWEWQNSTRILGGFPVQKVTTDMFVHSVEPLLQGTWCHRRCLCVVVQSLMILPCFVVGIGWKWGAGLQ